MSIDSDPATAPSPGFYSNPFAPFRLSLQEKLELRRVVTTLLDEFLQHYDDFQLNPNVPSNQWKRVQQRGDFTLYVENKGPWKPADDTGQLDVMLGTGTYMGALDDIMYAATEPTIGDVRLHAAYTKDTSLRTSIIETIDGPCDCDPFRTTSLRWLAKDFPIKLLMAHRDTTYIDATGVTVHNGERLGFHVLHTVHFPELPPMKEYIRIGLSIVCVWRQQTPTTITSYCRAILDVKDAMLKPLIVNSVGAGILCTVDLEEIALRKKIACLVRRQHRALQQQDLASETSSEASSVKDAPSAECTACHKRFKVLYRRKRRCEVCREIICHNCAIKKTLLALRYDGAMCRSKVRLCLKCLRQANALSAEEIARHEYAGATAMESQSPISDRLAPCLPAQVLGEVTTTQSSSSSSSEPAP